MRDLQALEKDLKKLQERIDNREILRQAALRLRNTGRPSPEYIMQADYIWAYIGYGEVCPVWSS